MSNQPIVVARREPQPIQAVQWTGSEKQADALQRWVVLDFYEAPDDTEPDTDIGSTVMSGINVAPIWRNDWVVRDEGGLFRVRGDREFKAEFAPTATVTTDWP